MGSIYKENGRKCSASESYSRDTMIERLSQNLVRTPLSSRLVARHTIRDGNREISDAVCADLFVRENTCVRACVCVCVCVCCCVIALYNIITKIKLIKIKLK